MSDIICLGEILIDFISMDKDVSLIESSGFTKSPGGAPANVAVGVARLGTSAGFIGKVGEDPFGHYLKNTLAQHNVDTSYLMFDNYARTTLAYLALKSDGSKDCMFYRNPGADMLLNEDEISENYIKNCMIFHYGSISLEHEISRNATLKAVEYAKRHNKIISYDPNLRLNLWENEQKAREGTILGLEYADIVKISEEEFEFVTGAKTKEACAEYLLKKGCSLVIVTLGKDGSFFSDGRNSITVKGYEVNAIETTGAGDAFVAALLSNIVSRIKKGEIKESILKADDAMRKCVEFANTAGALATTKIGAIPSLPTYQEIFSRLI